MLKLVSVNIERDKHFDRVIPFLENEKPDVLCVQELRDADVEDFARRFGRAHVYAPQAYVPHDNFTHPVGVAIFTNLPAGNEHVRYYVGSAGDIPREMHPEKKINHVLAALDVEKEGVSFRIATTHFTWTPDGGTNDRQREDLEALLVALEPIAPFTLCGDFNAPRGGEIFSKIAARYADNIPAEYRSSIDLSLHRAGEIDGERLSRLMVDGLFTTAEYAASGVRLVSGVSDHCAIVAALARAS